MTEKRLASNGVRLAAIAAVAVGAWAQDQNLPPSIDSVTFSLNSAACPGTFDPATTCIREDEFLGLCITLTDGNFNAMDNNETVVVTVRSTWLPFVNNGQLYGPEPGPITSDTQIVVQSGTPTVQRTMFFVAPRLAGPNQARLRGLTNFDAQFMVEIIAIDSQEARDEFTFTTCTLVNPVLQPNNPPPFADAGPNQTVEVNSTVKLDASATFDGSNIGFSPLDENVFQRDDLDYTWEWISGPVRVDPVAPIGASNPAIMEVTLDTVGTYVYRVLVDDGVNPPSTSSTTITVLSAIRPNNAPKAVVNGPTTPVVVGSIITLDGTTSRDPDGDALSFRWRQTDEVGGTLGSEDLPGSFQPVSGLQSPIARWQAVKAGTYYFRLLVSDGQVTDSARVSVEVVETAAAGTASTRGGTTTADGGGTDALGLAPVVPACGAGLSALALVPLLLAGLRRRIR